MIVCVCRRISDREIVRHAKAGLSFDDIQFELGVATQCGRCESCAREVVQQCCAARPVAAVHADMPAQVIQLASQLTSSRSWQASQHSAAV